MAKKVLKNLKLQVKGGQANPAPPLGPALGQAGVNINEFVTKFNDDTKSKMGELLSVKVVVFEDRTFEYVIKTAPASSYIKKAAGVDKGAQKNKSKKVGKITTEQLRKIAEEKLVDLSANDVEAAMKIIEGSARSMGIEVTK